MPLVVLGFEANCGRAHDHIVIAHPKKPSNVKYSLSAFGTHAPRAFSASSRGPRKEIAQLQQSFAVLAVTGNFLNFIAICFFHAWVLLARRRAKFRQAQHR
jgi:hypothetical protein